MTEVEYEELKDYTLLKGAEMGIQKMDCEDALHDAILVILEKKLDKPTWKSTVSWCLAAAKRNDWREARRFPAGFRTTGEEVADIKPFSTKDLKKGKPDLKEDKDEAD